MVTYLLKDIIIAHTPPCSHNLRTVLITRRASERAPARGAATCVKARLYKHNVRLIEGMLYLLLINTVTKS